MKVTVRVDGLKDLEARLAELPLATGKNVLRRAGREALEVFDDEWRRNAPYDTGALADSGSVGSNLSRSQRRAIERESAIEVFAGPGSNPQAVQQEFGNAKHPAQPFMRPAWDATKDRVLENVKAGLAAEIDKAVKRRARKLARAAAGGK